VAHSARLRRPWPPRPLRHGDRRQAPASANSTPSAAAGWSHPLSRPSWPPARRARLFAPAPPRLHGEWHPPHHPHGSLPSGRRPTVPVIPRLPQAGARLPGSAVPWATWQVPAPAALLSRPRLSSPATTATLGSPASTVTSSASSPPRQPRLPELKLPRSALVAIQSNSWHPGSTTSSPSQWPGTFPSPPMSSVGSRPQVPCRRPRLFQSGRPRVLGPTMRPPRTNQVHFIGPLCGCDRPRAAATDPRRCLRHPRWAPRVPVPTILRMPPRLTVR